MNPQKNTEKNPRRKARKNANGDGSIYQLEDGRWQCSVTVGTHPETGKPIRKTRTRRSRADCAAAKRQLERDRDDGVVPSSSSLTVGQFIERWIEDTVEPNLEPTTSGAYRRSFKNHIAKHLGGYRLRDLHAVHVTKWLADLDRAGVGGSARQYAFRVLRTALNQAVSLRQIAINPCLLTQAPRHDRREMLPFTADEVRRIFEQTATSPLHAAYVIALSHGLRYGEVFGLSIDDVDFTSKTIHVRRQLRCVNGRPPEFVKPKTKSSVRSIALTERSIEALNDRRRILLQEGRASSPVLFCSRFGGIMWPQVWQRHYWKPLLETLNIEHRGFHHCRHTFATLSLRDRVPVHVVSKILGHSNPAMTLNFYSHAMPTDQAIATESISRLYG